MKVAILLSTYNGGRFLAEQLNSLVSQSFEDFKVYIRDDGSSDNTKEIIERFCLQDKRIFQVESDYNIGCAASFLTLVKSIQADVYMFCDQDDIWLPNKVQRVVDYFLRINMEIPTLYHCDLQVVDENLELIHKSFLKHQKMSAINSMTRSNLFIQNFVVGCSSAINLSLAKMVLKSITDQDFQRVAMHDWWFAVTARLFGQIYYDNVQTILYRQHSNNVLGAKSSNIFRFIALGINGQGLNRVLSFRRKVSDQNKLLLRVYDSELNFAQRRNINLVVQALDENASIKKLLKAFLNGCYMQGFKRNLALAYSIVLNKKN
ncbi:glycosyltransferase family 2 protein [Citrobacter freundii]|uniref:glycosyltransferase family 2 protein n=1 Tax=Citrobacter freundii TaxID=546 RepID=UPI001397A4E3|nr:glycosyltransferase family 2 protein [Citrobacter freundii]MDE8797408.1 glycosyltransferase family 2 protein [Citrobacter freundii]MDV1318298.1 glycosyltransferase family 2 protein [Citrobacter freundii]MEB0347052.1 glycosyltransferase family 2 protein [Citrobacter freundii]MEC5781786.1 glycosyltransferase family 2 protein [Citrobacter freundii]QHX04522.1 glycosyltransferase family 2 protein [Citrobacter freundii]